MKTLIGVVGLFLFLLSLLFSFSLWRGENKALSLDNEETKYGSIGEGALPCTWDVNEPERLMTENKSQAITIEVTNSVDIDCESILSLRAPGFDLSPAKDEQKISLTSGAKGSLSWILAPRKTGTFEIAISDITNSKIFGIAVANVFGLTTIQAKIFSVLGSLFGPMLTIPWWVEKWWHRRKQKLENKNDVA